MFRKADKISYMKSCTILSSHWLQTQLQTTIHGWSERNAFAHPVILCEILLVMLAYEGGSEPQSYLEISSPLSFFPPYYSLYSGDVKLSRLEFVCMCVCMYVCMYVCTYIRIYVCTYVRMYVCMYVTF